MSNVEGPIWVRLPFSALKGTWGQAQYQLDPESLKHMPPQERERQIVQRADFIAYHHHPEGVGNDYTGTMYEALSKNDFSTDHPNLDQAHTVDTWKQLMAMFPPDEGMMRQFSMLNPARKSVYDKYIKYSNQDRLQQELEANKARFETGELCKRLRALFTECFKQKKNIKKIVAFGCGSLTNPTEPDSTFEVHAQHAALLIIREIWETMNDGKMEIILQDPFYNSVDQRAAMALGMTISCARADRHLGFVSLDETTLMVDFRCNFPIYSMAFEITRPAAIFSAASWDLPDGEKVPELGPDGVLWFKLEQDDQSVVVPGFGVSQDAFLEQFRASYNQKSLDLSGIRFENSPDHKVHDPCNPNGLRGISFLGGRPTLCTRI